MTNIRIDKIQIKRGTVANLPTLDDGELFYAYDTKEHYLGMGGQNELISKDFVSLNQHYENVLSRFGVNGSGNLTIDDVEFTGGGSGALVFNTLTDLQAAYPNGTNQPVWVVADNSWFYWSGAVTPPADTTAPTLTITAGGTFTGTKSVTMSVNETADIYYTLDGSTPTTSSTKYTSPLSVSATTTLKAFAKDTAGNSSAVQAVTYTLDTAPPADTTAPSNVTNLAYSNLAQTSLTLTWTASASSDVASYDVYNGSTLLANVTGTTYNVSGLSASTQYTFAVKAKDAANNVASGTSVTVTTSAPADTTAPVLTITPAATFTDTQTVTMSTNETATIWYTLDDTDPTTSGTRLQYTAPLTLTATDTVKAYAVDSANNASAVQTVTYTKQVSASNPLTTVTSGLIHSYDFTTGTGTQTTVTDITNDLDLTLQAYTFDGTNGWLNGGLKSNNVGWAKATDMTKFVGVTANSYTVIMRTAINSNAISGAFASSADDNDAIHLDADQNKIKGRFQFTIASNGALYVHPSVTYRNTSANVIIRRDDYTTAAKTLINDTPVVLAFSVNNTSLAANLYLNGNLHKNTVVEQPMKFDGVIINSGNQTAYELLIYNRVLTQAEIQTVSTELLA